MITPRKAREVFFKARAPTESGAFLLQEQLAALLHHRGSGDLLGPE